MAPIETPRPYEYQPLKDDEIRILHLQSGEMNDTIFIEISHEKLSGKIKPYHALSWEWGPGLPNHEIRIKDKGSNDSNVWTIKIKPNLAVALRHLRLRHAIRRLWVDAICINQIEQTDETQNRPQQNWGIALSKVNLNLMKRKGSLQPPQTQRECGFIWSSSLLACLCSLLVESKMSNKVWNLHS
jgi:Heterokaryon incompatibility protein (HET)